MATATRMITTTDITHVEMLVKDQDIKVTDNGELRCLQFGGAFIYLDTNGVTALLERLLMEPEAIERSELLPELHRCADHQQTRADDMTRQAV